MAKLALLVVLVLGCGSVTPKASDDGAAGAGGQLEASGGAGGAPAATGGAGGELGGRGGHVATGGAAGANIGALTAPACPAPFTGSNTQCPRIADPANPTNVNGGWQCEVDCAPAAAEPCVYYGVTYCVRSCSDCRP